VGFDRNGYDVNGYNANGYSRNGFDRNGFDLNHCARYVLAAERRCVQRSHRDHHVTSPAQPIGELDDRDVTPVDGVVSPFFSGTCTGRVSLLTTQAKSGARMKKIEKNGFVLASSGSATQVVLYSHGGWIESDGVTTIPMGLTLCFYAGHGHYTVGNSVYGAVVKKGATARGGFMKQIAMSEEDLAAYAQMKGKSVDWARDEFMKNAVGTYDSFQGGNPMFNYALSREPKGQRLKNEQDVFKKHMKGGGHADVDLIMMTTSGGRHLSDVFTLIEGRGYATLHFGACRVSYGSSPSEVSK
jgi:hypothetical protein